MPLVFSGMKAAVVTQQAEVNDHLDIHALMNVDILTLRWHNPG